MLESDLVKEAQSFAQSEAVSELLKRLEEKYVADWKSSTASDAETREHSYRMVLAITALRDELNNVAQSTKINQWNRRLRGVQV